MKIKLIALFIMMRSLAAIADNDTYFFSKVDYQQGLSNSAVLCLFQDNVGLDFYPFGSKPLLAKGEASGSQL